MKKFVFIILTIAINLSAQNEKNIHLSGSLINDTQFAFAAISDSNKSFKLNITQNKKTPIIAALMSFALPGAGQIYTEDYLLAGIFAAVEIGAVVVAVTYNTKGDDQTEFYESYANAHWSVDRYADWTLANLNENANIAPNLNPDDYREKLFDAEGNVIWRELNNLEDAIPGYYSHHLAPYGDQQYYEMIGKYSQFNVGWEDFWNDPNNPNHEFIYGRDDVVDQFKYYSKERGKANDYYNVAKWAVITVVSNHFISALEAAWSANRYNKKMNFNISLEEETLGYNKEFYPQLNLKYNF
ncbi:MAG: hypothetical protein KDC88_14280 [Ignavibacteriae bacterium]|nr:hypothetical protein [Ignavibacteriota bacterium]MCB9207113.1 hypothetical protein [Ignavibacteriales bacterium]MCB9209964.1 hypothetical protein [Ignavibacteriales bacterium]MCB9218651.1 hypothetical protein [Ignavibacteriales bacterium]MCB9259343.1 hypothetical protein [Ignavibacteriales bacterium]